MWWDYLGGADACCEWWGGQSSGRCLIGDLVFPPFPKKKKKKYGLDRLDFRLDNGQKHTCLRSQRLLGGTAWGSS